MFNNPETKCQYLMPITSFSGGRVSIAVMMLVRAMLYSISLRSSTQDYIWSQTKHFHASFHNSHNVSMYVK